MRNVLSVLSLIAAGLSPAAGESASRPPIVGVANIWVKTANPETSRNFYERVLGLQQAFTLKRPGRPGVACYKVNDRQYVLVSPELKGATEDRLVQIGFETKDAAQLRSYLAAHGVAVPAKLAKDADGNLSFTVTDPAGRTVEFVQYLPGSVQGRSNGKFLGDTRVSDHILHLGIHITDADLEKQDGFYQGLLGFRPLWKGGMTDTHMDWISLEVPDGGDWVEYMVNSRSDITPAQLGVMHHFCLGTLDIQSVYRKVLDRGYKPPQEPHVARDGRWLMNLFDPDLTRAEVMIRKPVETPCCSPMHDDRDQ